MVDHVISKDEVDALIVAPPTGDEPGLVLAWVAPRVDGATGEVTHWDDVSGAGRDGAVIGTPAPQSRVRVSPALSQTVATARAQETVYAGSVFQRLPYQNGAPDACARKPVTCDLNSDG